VRDVSFTIEPGERVLLLGASGAGKSTLLAGLAGVLGDADEGERTGTLLIDGAAPESRRGAVGLVLQDPDAGVVLSKVGDDVAFGCENLGVPADEIPGRVASALAAVGLDVPLDRPTKALSGGQKQRLALAGVLAMQPGLLLLDEPTANLDPAGVREVHDSVGRALDATGATFIVVEHRTEVWLDLLTRVIVVAADGGLLADGPPSTVFAQHGDALAAAGVWVPHHEIDVPVLPPADPAAPSVLETVDLAVSRDRRLAVQSGLGIRIPRGSATVVTGPNGAGKSTLALTLAGLLPELEGLVLAASDLPAAPAVSLHAGSPASCSPASERCSRNRSTSSSPALCATSWPSVRVLSDSRTRRSAPSSTTSSSACSSHRSRSRTRSPSAAGRRDGSRWRPCSPPPPRYSCSTSPPSVRTGGGGSASSSCCRPRSRRAAQ